MADEIELECIWWDGHENGSHEEIALRNPVISRIVMRTDGHGLSGFYDRIHIYDSDGDHRIFPAHHVHGWLLKDKDHAI